MDRKKIERGMRLILEGIGEDPERPGLQGTPGRVADLFSEVFAGVDVDAMQFLVPVAGETHDEMVLVKDISMHSMCEHHLLPFIGVAHVAYIPEGGRIVGLSKIVRVLDTFAHQPQVQERLTTQVAEAVMNGLRPKGVMVVIEAEHMCMSMRGVNKPNSRTVTSAVRGSFRRDERTRSETLSLIYGSRSR
ncbi:MAG TPA: GTP cyclohydrolase I FolE [Proteobacteria bacterium]|nr:GTP cyclohydrolase 1 [bacterium BMS3Abin14]HDL53005.1 GTP cyclohydrolase I FolE [Pseudomonadota bacterium]